MYFCFALQVQLLVSDSDVESYKQIKADLDTLRQSVEKSELWVYKSKSVDELGNKKGAEDEEDQERQERTTPAPQLGTESKQGSLLELDVGPPLHEEQAQEYKKIRDVSALAIEDYL